jgi:hypothetical protein
MYTKPLKLCKRCGIEKPLGEFNKQKDKRDGLKSYCKICNGNVLKLFRANNRSRGSVVVPDSKKCPGCKTEKFSHEFYRNSANKDGLNWQCKNCESICMRKSNYGVTEEWRQVTLRAQGGFCAICKEAPGCGDSSLSVDHDHQTGAPRGLLCGNCNRGIGHLRDSIDLLGKAEEYLSGQTLGILYNKKLAKAEKDRIITNQGHVCKVCSAYLPVEKARLDHCHLTGLVRGCLCHGCNCGLGLLKDSPAIMRSAIEYLVSNYFVSDPKQSFLVIQGTS